MKSTLFAFCFLLISLSASRWQLKVDLGPDFESCLGNHISVKAHIKGGTGPYDIYWSSNPYKYWSRLERTSIYFLFENSQIIMISVTDKNQQKIFDTVAITARNNC